MKNLFLTAIAIMALSVTTNAQTIRLGVKAGPNFASFSGSTNDIDYTSRTSFHAGAVLEIKTAGNFAIQPEFLYSSQGADVDGAKDFNLDYISVPVMAKFYILTDRLTLDAGPQFSFLVDHAAEVVNTKKFDFAVAGGATLFFTKDIFAQARYTIGLTEVSKNTDVKNAVFQVSLGYMF